MEFATGNRNHDLAAHDLPFVMGIGVVFPGAVMVIPLGRWIEGGQFFQPPVVIVVETALVVIESDSRFRILFSV